MSVRGGVQVGGASGFAANVSGVVSTAEATASLTVSHAGGWSPLTGAFSSLFTTPPFSGTCKLGVAGVHTSLSADASWAEAIDVVPCMLSLTGGDTDAGPRLKVPLTKGEAESQRGMRAVTWHAGGGVACGR